MNLDVTAWWMLQRPASQAKSLECILSLLLPHPDRSGDGVLFSIYFFVSLFLCQQDYEKTAGPICMKFLGKVRSDHGTTWFNFGSIRRNHAMTMVLICLSAFVNIMIKQLDRFAWNFQGRYGVTMGRPYYIFGQFQETARCHDAQHGGRICCALAPQLVHAFNNFNLVT